METAPHCAHHTVAEAEQMGGDWGFFRDGLSDLKCGWRVNCATGGDCKSQNPPGSLPPSNGRHKDLEVVLAVMAACTQEVLRLPPPLHPITENAIRSH